MVNANFALIIYAMWNEESPFLPPSLRTRNVIDTKHK